jgi:hypothetical protein|nr:MAG TPA: hypothetical protein [Caudoviricetes sp.]
MERRKTDGERIQRKHKRSRQDRKTQRAETGINGEINMITLSEFIKVVPQIKEGSFRYKILGEKNPFPENSIFSFEYVWFKDFANRFDFKRLQVVKCERRYIGYENGSEEYCLTLKKIEGRK